MHEGHRKRLRERFLKEGLDSFDKHNALELLLFYSISRRDTNEIAHRLIETFGSLSAVFDAPYEELLKVPDIGENSACLIKMIPALFRIYKNDRHSDDIVVDSTEAAGNLLLRKYIGIKNEMVSMICMDNKGKVINWDVVSEGSVNASEINTRRVTELALRHNATSVILAHNHPNGVALPSRQDLLTTENLVKALRMIGVYVIDHIILAGDDFVSLADSESLQYIFDAE